MNKFNKWVVAVCLSVVIICAQLLATQYSTICHMRQKLEMAQMAHQLSMEQIGDIQQQLQTLQSRVDTSRTQGFVAGILDATQRRDYYAEIWHAGYSRGAAVQQQISQIDREENKRTGYTAAATTE